MTDGELDVLTGPDEVGSTSRRRLASVSLTAGDPGSIWPVHGLCHVLSAGAFMVWGFAASDRNREQIAPSAVDV